MPDAPESFWPSEIPDPTDPSPVALLKEQAELLADKTRGEIKGVVRMYIEQETVYHSLYLTADALGDYLYKILSISHPVLGQSRDIYPISAESSINDTTASLVDDVSFRTWLRTELSSEHVRSILGTLKGYVRERRSAQIG